MKVMLESTTKIVELKGPGGSVPARIWEGQTESGIKVHAFITRLAVNEGENQEQFLAELEEQRKPSAEVQTYPLRLVL